MEAKIDIKKFRKKYNLTRMQLAAMVGVSVYTVASWEQNRYIPSTPVLKLIEYIEKNYNGKNN